MKSYLQFTVVLLSTMVVSINSQVLRHKNEIRPLFRPGRPPAAETGGQAQQSPIEIWKALNNMNQRSKSSSYQRPDPIQHPPVLTRPPHGHTTVIPRPQHRDAQDRPDTVTYPPTTVPTNTQQQWQLPRTKTTAEPPELDEIISARMTRRLFNSFRRPQQQRNIPLNTFNARFNRISNPTSALNPFNLLDMDHEEHLGALATLGLGGSLGGGGGVSMGESGSWLPRRHRSPAWNRNHRHNAFMSNLRHHASPFMSLLDRDDDFFQTTTTYRPPTPAPVVNEDMCFCSPLTSCPSGSVQSGGSCNSFMSLFTNVQFRKCCYQPNYGRRG